MKKDRLFSYFASAIILAEIVLIILSWLITAAYPELSMRSILSGEGVRWLLGHFVDNQMSPVMVWMMLIAIAVGAVVKSGLLGTLRSIGHLNYRERLALRLVSCELIVSAFILILLTSVPNAVLLNVTGKIYPSSFSDSIVPIMSFIFCVCSITFGSTVGRITLSTGFFDILTYGIIKSAPLFVIYILLAELYHTVCFVFLL